MQFFWGVEGLSKLVESTYTHTMKSKNLTAESSSRGHFLVRNQSWSIMTSRALTLENNIEIRF